jgi:predicted metal-binding protein
MALGVQESLNDLSCLAIKLGAADAKLIKAGDIIVSDWVRLKCQYGCGGYRKRLTCPPYSLKPEESKRIPEGYEWAMLSKFDPRRPDCEWRSPHEAAVELEREAFPEGYYSAFGLACGPCPYCDECNLEKCVHPDLARPSMEACGTDVYATVRRAGFDLEVVKSRDEKPTYFGLLLVK